MESFNLEKVCCFEDGRVHATFSDKTAQIIQNELSK